LDRAIDEARPDAVLCISSQHLVFAKKSELPVFMVSDAPWMAYKMAYKKYDAIPLLASFYARLEAAAARRISGVIYPTPWACNEAITRFDLTEEKVHWISLGANRFCMDSEEQVLSRILNKSPDPVKFLFIGKDWDRKGGPLALQVVRQLNQCGCSSRLKIIGCTPAIDEGDAPHVQVLGYLSPAKLEDQRSMQTAYEEAHFFLVPSHAECYGLVFAEAQSYGLPCISLTSQGIPGVVDSGVTGLLFEPNADVQTIVDRVLRLIEDWTAYEAMATAARRKYVQELNWDAFGARTYQLFNAALSKTQSGQLAV
jgi:glycosyltransferase involved in cell wall biosynthesis